MTATHGCKVCRVLDERGLDGYDERLLADWRGEDGARKGYRRLARDLNVALLRREMDAAGLSTLGDEPASKYERLRGDGASAAEVAKVLDRQGVGVDRLRSDFVSYGVVRTHLLDCLDAEYDPDPAGDWEGQAVDIAVDRARNKVAEAVRARANKGELASGGTVTVHLDADVECEACRTRVPLRRALRRGRVCRCGHGTTDRVVEGSGDVAGGSGGGRG